MARIHQFKLGTFNCISLEDAHRQVALTTEFPQVDHAALTAAMEKCGYTTPEIEVGSNALFIDTGTHKVLIDTGRGTDELMDSLALADILPKDIDTVVITHGDGDHIGGIQHFLNAEFILPQYAWDLWTSPDGLKTMIEEFERVFGQMLSPPHLLKAIERRKMYGEEMLPVLDYQMRRVADEEEFLPGMRLISTPGHRSDHFAVEIQSEGSTLIHVADCMRHCIQATHPEWYSTYDSYPEQMGSSVQKMINRGKEKGALFFAAHFTFPGLAKIEEDGEMRLFCD